MKKTLLPLVLLIFAAILAGCASQRQYPQAQIPPMQKADILATVAEIDALCVSSEPVRIDGFRMISRRPLTGWERAYLVDKISRTITDPGKRQDLLLAEIKNHNSQKEIQLRARMNRRQPRQPSIPPIPSVRIEPKRNMSGDANPAKPEQPK